MSTIKRTNRFRMRLNSIRQHSNYKWKQFSNLYSKFLLRFPWSILAISSFITIGLTVCFFLLMQVRPFDQNDFLIPNGQAIKNAFRITQLFGNDTELRMHQQLNLYPGLDIIIKRKFNSNETNMLTNEIIDEIRLLDEKIQSIRINNSIEYNYSSLCTKINHACIIDGNYILTDKFRQDISHLLPPKYGYYFDPSGANGVPGFMFGKDYQVINITQTNTDYEENNDSTEIIEATLETIISHVSLFRLRYSLNTSTIEMRQLAIQWEREVLKYLNEEYQSTLIDLFPLISTAITDTITKKAHEEGLYMGLMLLIFLIFYYLVLTIQGNFHTSVGYLPFCGIISIGLSTGATFGFLSLFRIQIIEPMAMLVFIVTIVDCMRFSIVCGEYHRIIKTHMITISDMSSEIDLEKILPSIIESTHPYFLTSTCIISFVYFIFSFISPMFSTKLICLTLTLYIFVNYLVHSTFFSSCLVITLKRISSRRHCLFCYRLPTDYYTKFHQKFTQLKIFKNHLNIFLNKDSLWKKFFTAIVCLIFFIFLMLSIWFTLSIDTRLFDDEFLPRDASTLRKHMQSQNDDFNLGPIIMFTIPEAINYENERIQLGINSLINQCQNEIRTNTFKLLWLDHENISYIITSHDDLQVRITPFSQNDLIVLQGLNDSIIKASRFYCQYKSIKGDREDIRTMNNIYTSTSQSVIPYVFPYSLVFPNYESLQQIRIEIYLLIILLIICSLISTLMSFLSFKNSLLILTHLLILLTGTLTCLYFFHNLTFNFANALWLYVIPIIFLDTLIHISYNKTNEKWKYNRIIFSLIISLIIFSLFPIQSYVFQVIHNSLIYQSIICLILINVILPSWNYLFQSMKNNEEINDIMKPPISIIEGNQSLTNGLEINRHLNSSI